VDTLSPGRSQTIERPSVSQDRAAGEVGAAASSPAWMRVVAWGQLTVIGLLGLGLLFAPAPFLAHHPGVVIDATGNLAGPAVTDPDFGDGGQFLLTTMRSTPLTWGGYAWFSLRLPQAARLVPIPRSEPPRSHFESLAAMDQSKDVAAAVAGCAVYRCVPEPVGVRVAAVRRGSPAHHGGLRPDDVIVAAARLPGPRAYADDPTTPELQEVQTILGLLRFPDEAPDMGAVRLDVLRGGEITQVRVASDDGPLGADLVTAWVAHRTLEVDTGNVGGPSTGLLLTLTLIDATTSGDLTGGRRVAGTGTIRADGTVGPIGGVAAKVTGAVRSGAQVFLVPPMHRDAARAAGPRGLHIVAVKTVRDALRWLCDTGGASEACDPAPPLNARTRL
jgi:PDZ domain-containing protein